MFQKVVIFLVIFSAILFQLSFFPNFFEDMAIPDVVLLVVMFWAARKGFEKTWLRTIVAGFFLDLAVFDVVGLNILSFTLISFGIGFLSKRFLVSDRAWRFFMILGIIVAGTIVNMILLDIFARIYSWIGMEENPIYTITLKDYIRPWVILYNAVLFSLIYVPMMRLEKILEFYEARTSNQRKFF